MACCLVNAKPLSEPMLEYWNIQLQRMNFIDVCITSTLSTTARANSRTNSSILDCYQLITGDQDKRNPCVNGLGPVSIKRPSYLRMVISMLKIRRPLGRLIFNMGIATPGKTVFLIETAPWTLITLKQAWQLDGVDCFNQLIAGFNFLC